MLTVRQGNESLQPIFLLRYSATVTNLQTKVESLTTTNALMKEDLAIGKPSHFFFIL